MTGYISASKGLSTVHSREHFICLITLHWKQRHSSPEITVGNTREAHDRLFSQEKERIQGKIESVATVSEDRI